MFSDERPLTEREYEVASVAGDLLMKGSPAHRIALHCVHRGLNKAQTETLLRKLRGLSAISISMSDAVMDAYDGARQASPDELYHQGLSLKIKIFEQKTAKTLDRMMTETERDDQRRLKKS